MAKHITERTISMVCVKVQLFMYENSIQNCTNNFLVWNCHSFVKRFSVYVYINYEIICFGKVVILNFYIHTLKTQKFRPHAWSQVHVPVTEIDTFWVHASRVYPNSCPIDWNRHILSSCLMSVPKFMLSIDWKGLILSSRLMVVSYEQGASSVASILWHFSDVSKRQVLPIDGYQDVQTLAAKTQVTEIKSTRKHLARLITCKTVHRPLECCIYSRVSLLFMTKYNLTNMILNRTF